MSDPSRLAVVIPCCNQVRYVAEAVASARRQEPPPDEVLVVDDGSTDGSGQAARRAGARVVDQPNGGVAAARNTGLRLTSAEVVCLLDADDRLRPGALAAGRAALRAHPAAIAAAGCCQPVDADGRLLPTAASACVTDDLYLTLLRHNPIWTPSGLIARREALLAAGGFDTGVPASADYDLYLRLARDGALVMHPAVVADYRQHDTAMSGDPALMLASTLRVHSRHGGSLRSAAERDAWRTGARAWRRFYGDALTDRLRSDARTPGRRGRAMRDLLVLVRLDPAGALRHLRRGMATRLWRTAPGLRHLS